MLLTANLLTGVVITVAVIVAAHMTTRVFYLRPGWIPGRIARYGIGSLAILAGLTQVLDVHTLCILLGFMVVAGVTTILCYIVVDRYTAQARADAAEEALDNGD